MLIAQVSDSHLRAKGVRLFGAIDAHAALERAVSAILALEPRPDAVIHTGDLVNDGDAADHAALSDLLGRLPMPFYAVPGNHDRRHALRKALAFTGNVASRGPLTVCAELGPVRLVGLDTLVEGQAGGRIGREQMAWLDATLFDAPGRPTLVFLHHPPFTTGIGFMDRIMLEDHAALSAVIARHPQVGLVACGHVHRMIQTRFAGTVAMIAPGVAHQVVLDLLNGAPPRWIAEPPGMLLHRWTAESGFVSHLSYLSDYGSGAPFHDRHSNA